MRAATATLTPPRTPGVIIQHNLLLHHDVVKNYVVLWLCVFLLLHHDVVKHVLYSFLQRHDAVKSDVVL